MSLLDTKEGRILLLSALKWAAQEWVEEDMIADMARLSDPPIKHAFKAILDPAKLAEMIAAEARRCSCAYPLHNDTTTVEHFAAPRCITVQTCGCGNGIKTIVVRLGLGGPNIYYHVSQARTVLAALMALPGGSKEAAEKTLRGEHG